MNCHVSVEPCVNMKCKYVSCPAGGDGGLPLINSMCKVGITGERLSLFTQPASVQIHGHKHGRNGEEIHHRIHLQPEPQLIIRCNEL